LAGRKAIETVRWCVGRRTEGGFGEGAGLVIGGTGVWTGRKAIKIVRWCVGRRTEGGFSEGAGLVIGGTGVWTGRRTGMAFAWIGAAGMSIAGRVGSGVLLYTGIDSNLTSSSAGTIHAIMVLAQEK